jgi:DNA replication protein DnaC
MELTLAAARAYAGGFGPDSTNLLLQGGTGLGKTLLSRCIAATVSAGGHSVVYETAQEAFGAFEEQKFSRDAETYAAASEKVKRTLHCELLILDDLGTELTTSFTQSALYNIVDSRLTAGRKTVISTNLTDAELAERYIPQIVSRIGGEYDKLPFLGRDIRAIRKEQRYG